MNPPDMNPPDVHTAPMSAPGERETAGVSDLPPPAPRPTPPPPGSPVAEARSVTADWDWDRVRDLAEYWYRPLTHPEGWKSLGYLAVGALTSAVFFAVMVAVGAVTFGLLFVVIGFALVNPAFRVVNWLTGIERSMAAWVGVEFPRRSVAPIRPLGFAAVRDGERWRQVGYLTVNSVLGGALFVAGSFCYSLVLRVIFDDPVGGFSLFGFGPILGLLALAFAALALGAAPRIVMPVARFKAHVAAWFLGPDRLAVAEQRVTTLSSQRSDILDAVASERRRIERNLHDGVQQQLVAIGLDLGMAEQQLATDPERARELIDAARTKVRGSIGELRQLGRGLHPAILEDRGIDAALSAVVSGSAIPISVHVDAGLNLSTDVGEIVYFVANEAIANILKHAHARVASVHVSGIDGGVRVTVHDDGVGGVDASRGTGIAGVRARVNAVDGTFTVTSPTGGPTTLIAEIPRR